MDSNGTRFQLLLGQSDWGACRVEGQSMTLAETWATVPSAELLSRHAWDASRSELMLPSQVFRFPAVRKTVDLSLSARRGADADLYGNRYWIDDSESGVLVKSVGSGTVSQFWSTGGPTVGGQPGGSGDFAACTPEATPPSTLRGLAVTRDDYLVVGVVDPPGLLVFDLHAGGPPRQLVWPDGFRPFDFAAGASGVWILDRDPMEQASRLWLLDRRLNVVTLTGVPPVTNAVAVEALPDGSALILDNVDFSQVWRYRQQTGLAGPFSLRDLNNLADDPSLSLVGHDMAYVAGSPYGTLLVVAGNGEQAYAFSVVVGLDAPTLTFQALPEYWPMRLYASRGLLMDRGKPLYNSRSDWVPLIQQQRDRYESELVLLTPVEPDPSNRSVRHAFDGRDPDCVWHRLMIDGCLPHDTEIHVWSRAANLESDLVNASWQPEPGPYNRAAGSELPFMATSQSDDRGTFELLFQQARGRFLQLRIQLTGNTRSTPRLRALRAYFPRFSYLEHYLPATYREDQASASFLDRFLANLEGMYTELEGRLENIQVLFDPRTAPAEDLTWLAAWLGIVLDGNWDEARQRLLIASAPELFRLRGTRLGLIRAIRLATDPCPTPALFEEMLDDESAPQPGRLPAAIRIVEQFRTRQAPGVVFGDPTQVQGPGFSSTVSAWTPQHGADPLHDHFRAYLTQKYGSLDAARQAWGVAASDLKPIDLPPTRPNNDVAAADWTHFLQTGLGFAYSNIDASDTKLYQDFLARRYGSVQAIVKAYGVSGTAQYSTFADVPLPATMPTNTRQLTDWIQFASIVVPTVRRAHRFTVLVPSALTATDNDRGALIDRVQRVVELEKPAHTVFDVKEYWALFRVGEARLGYDSLLDRGSRLVPTVLDSTYLAGGYLAPPHPFNVADRMLVGRDHIGDERPL